jgi:AcrR family transcriptional regulator
MRARLAAAAYATIADGGLKALRLRAVADAAGVSQGALLHHFPDKNALVLAAIEQALTLARDDSVAWVVKAAANPEAELRAMLAELRAMGITLEASKDCDFYAVVRSRIASLRNPIYSVWEGRLVTLGWSPDAAMRDVRAGAAMVSGAAIRRLWADCDEVTEAVEEEWITQRLTLRC